jgi:transcriptional regulator GlxA family with amidase domain
VPPGISPAPAWPGADLLQDTSQTIDAIARQTGYASPFASSTAFRRRFGQPPRSFRRAAGAADAYPG